MSSMTVKADVLAARFPVPMVRRLLRRSTRERMAIPS